MSSSPPLPALRTVRHRVAAVTRRVALLHGVRATAWGMGAAVLALCLVCLSADPVLTPATARALRGLVVLCGLGAALLALRPALQRRGSALGAFWIGRLDVTLGSRTRSALELGHALPAGMSPVLFSAHVEAVAQDLSRLPTARVVPWSTLRQRDLAVALVALSIGVGVLAFSPRARLGAHALFNPARIDAQGVREAAVVDTLSARLTFPGYLQRPATELDDLGMVSAPVGTTLDLRATLRMSGEDVVVQLGAQQVRLARGDDAAYSGRVVVRESAPLSLRLSSDGAWYQDAVARKVEAIVDGTPVAELLAPMDGVRVRADEQVAVQLRAADDVALDQVELVVRLPSGNEQRRRLWSAASVEVLTPTLDKNDAFIPERVGAVAGDALLVWIEARDGDVVSGPKLGRSAAVRIEVASTAQEAALQIPPLREVLDQAIDLLADRLEHPPSEAATEAPRLQSMLRAKTDSWLTELGRIVVNLREQPGEPLADLDELRGMVDRNRTLLQRENALYAAQGGHGGQTTQAPRQVADTKLVEEQETDVLTLSDMLAAALVDEANQLTADLKALREHIKQLLEQLKNSKSPEARQALLAEIQRAQERLQALARSLSAVATQVPSEFINQEALDQGEARSSMQDLKDSVMADDLDAAAKHLEDLAEQVERLAQDLKEGSVRFSESRNGARNGALSEAQRKLSMIASEQERLASRSRDMMREATERAGGPGTQKTDELGKQADQLAKQLEQLGERESMGMDGRGMERARDRLRDARDALRTGDLAEARRMTLEGERDLDQASRDLANDARMFPGHQGEAAKRAEAALDALERLQRLQQAIDRATPRLDEHLDRSDRQQLADDARPQHDTRDATQQLAEQLKQGPDGRPLSDTGAAGLEEVQQAMAEAERALKQGDVRGANAAQEAASGQLRQLAQDLQRKKSRKPGQQGEPGEQGQPRPGERGQESADGPHMAHEDVHIPGAEDFVSPTELRRRLLDAMREGSPTGFEAANERYYRELLR